MADIRFKYSDIQTSVTKINTIQQSYLQAGTKLIKDIETATTNWQGASKDKYLKLIQGDVNKYVTTTVPDIVKALSDMLKQNGDSMKEADTQIAQSLPETLG